MAVRELQNWPDCRNVKPLTKQPGFRLRVGSYRVLFDVEDELRIVEIEEVKKRMIAPINHQIIEKDGRPLFVLVPYDEYMAMIEKDAAVRVPQAVVEKHVLENMSLVRAWREHLGFSQQEVAKKLGVSQSAYSQMEKTEANLRKITVHKIAGALGILPEQLDV